MCHRATCRKCSKPTWRGCGNHIEQALAGVAKRERCTCREDSAAMSSAPREGILSRLFGR
jgi:hypothetical protein